MMRESGDTEVRFLEGADELPELVGNEVVLEWDMEGDERFERPRTVLRHGGRAIWREPAYFEGASRFREVSLILLARYGGRLVDLVPTPWSEVWLYGDDMRAPDTVRAARRRIRRTHHRAHVARRRATVEHRA